MSEKIEGLPVAGYRAQSAEAVAQVNRNKQLEERILRLLDGAAADPETDKRWLALARTHIEQGFMALNRAVFKPGRVALPEDGE
jgi:cytochrome c-type biogenesis protein CcmH/NrfG